ncbi:hypothetical protein EMCRGX_G010689, partial [Ephydatia muelleri]
MSCFEKIVNRQTQVTYIYERLSPEVPTLLKY